MDDFDTLICHWQLALRGKDAHWVPIENDGASLYAKIPYDAVDAFAETAPDDLLEATDGLAGVFETAIRRALACGRTSYVADGDGSNRQHRVVTVETTDLQATFTPQA
ncbi:hypothetical protein ACFB49_22060 [Sphingomonas sp. DBB INV C78]|uniref:hypothetical protein n=1 Tax=Sphingomonas sp. DBB INV C78 TaxID=3349434 RepID=UPI0036D43786